MSKTAALQRRITDKVSDVLSAPSRFKERNSKRKSDYELGVIQKHRAIRKHGTDDRRPARDPDSAARTMAEYQRIRSEHGFK